MQLDVSLTKKILITILIMLVLIAFVYYFNIPNPNMILIAGLVLCSALFGFGGGIVAAVIMLFYTLYFFSTDNSFIQFTPENMQKVGVSLVGIVVDMVLVCSLKRSEMQAFSEVHDLTEQLHEENERLKNLSLIDALTRVRNRLALRQDYDSYKGHEVTVMMLDLDDFKSINDTQGHAEGDRMLQETGRLLSDTFGNEHCYRYGGDEFLIIVPDISEEEFKQKLDQMLTRKPILMIDGKETKAGFSFGYVHDHLNESVELRKLISAADERMYNAKRDK
jgi:diguanylate cyclase (GGDEF)-like protein